MAPHPAVNLFTDKLGERNFYHENRTQALSGYGKSIPVRAFSLED